MKKVVSHPPPEAARDALYAAPLSEFMGLRARLAEELRARGDKELAKAVLALRKPNTAAWGLNQLARRHPGRLVELYEARADAEHAQAGGDVVSLRAKIAHYRAGLDELVGWVDSCLREAGASPTRESLRSVRARLEAASLDPKGAGTELAAACLVEVREGEGSGPSGFVLPAPAAAASVLRPREPRPKEESVVDLAAKRLQEQAKRRLDEATAVLEAAETGEAAARAQLESAEQSLAAASRAVGEARAMVEAARSELSRRGLPTS